MIISKNKTHNARLNIIFMILNSLVLTLILFYVNGDYHDVLWIKDPTNWIVFTLYTAAFIVIQVIHNQLLLRNYDGEYDSAPSTIMGIPLGLLIIFLMYIFKG